MIPEKKAPILEIKLRVLIVIASCVEASIPEKKLWLRKESLDLGNEASNWNSEKQIFNPDYNNIESEALSGKKALISGRNFNFENKTLIEETKLR